MTYRRLSRLRIPELRPFRNLRNPNFLPKTETADERSALSNTAGTGLADDLPARPNGTPHRGPGAGRRNARCLTLANALLSSE